MPDTKMGTDKIELSEREILAMRIIQKHMDDPGNYMRRPPTMRHLLDQMNLVMEKNKKPTIKSTQQIHRIVISLRAKGLMYQVQPGERLPNMVLTPAGKRELVKAI